MSWKVKIDEADRLFSEWIRRRDGACVRCGRKGTGLHGIVGLQNSHFQGRRKEGTRFDPENCDGLCSGCHSYFTSNPGEHYLWQVQKKGQEAVDALILRSNLYHRKDRQAEALYWRQALKVLDK